MIDNQNFKSLTSYYESCQTDCKDAKGHVPYFYEVESIINQLYENNTINDIEFPMFTADFRRRNIEMDSINR